MRARRKTGLRIVVPADAGISRPAIVALQKYVEQVTATPTPIVADAEGLPDTDAIVVGNEKRNRVAGRIGFRQDWAGTRPDGYALRTIRSEGRTCLVAAGCAEPGDKYAAYHLIRALPVKGNTVTLSVPDVVMSPFLKTREVIMSDACPWDPYAPEAEVPEAERARTYDNIFNTEANRLNRPAHLPDQTRMVGLRRVVNKYCIENWDHGKLADYVNQVDAFGFNSIEFADNDESYLHSGGLVSRRDYREKLVGMMRQARALGHRIALSVLGGNVPLANGLRVLADWDDPLGDEIVHFNYPLNIKASSCWQEEEGRQAIDAQLHYLAGYAPNVDHIYSHFVDPGGCNRNGCTIGTCMRLMNHHLRLFREVNPRITATFNTWPLTSDFTGFRMGDVYRRSSWNRTYTWWHFLQVVDLLDPDIMIASRTYNPEVARLCRQWSRPYGLWRWYSCDQEITAALHVEAERLGREFSALPPEAAELEYCSMPSNCHGLNAATLYLAARLMWEPKRDAFALLREFAGLVFGPRIGGAVYDGYAAIARVRNHDVNGDSAFDDSYLGAGTPDPDADARVSGEALEALRHVCVDQQWVSKLPLAYTREGMLEDLVDHLQMVHQYAEFRAALRRLIRQDRITPDDYQRLPTVEKLRVSGGMIEWRKYADFLRAGCGKVAGGDDT